MDIFSHAIAGAAAGAIFQLPGTGAFFGVLPDLVLGLKRVATPPARYKLTHSFLFILVLPALLALADAQIAKCAAVALASHLILDLPTHGPVWAPRLLYPFSEKIFVDSSEWEWGNKSWTTGFLLTLNWSVVCLTITFARL